MRISSNWSQQQAVKTMNRRESGIAHTRRQLSTGKRILAPADDPIGATQTLGINRTVSRTEQFQRNISQVRARLNQEAQALSAVTQLLQKIRQGTIQASTASQTNKTRGMIGATISQRAKEIGQIANTRDGTGDYIFAGYRADIKPFETTPDGMAYRGDQGQRLFRVGPDQIMPAGDNGAVVFQRIPNGNGAFAVIPDSGNNGGGVIGASTVSDPGTYQPGTFTITFTSPHEYSVRNAENKVVTTGQHQAGDSIKFNGIQFVLDGDPAAGDQFTVQPSDNQSLFTTLNRLVETLKQPMNDVASQARMHNGINAGIRGLDRALTRVLQVRARVGARLNNLDDQKSLNGAFNVELKEQRADIQDTDFAAASSRLLMQKAVLQAAQKAFVKVQNLSLFNLLR